MRTRSNQATRLLRFLSVTLAVTTAAGPWASTWAQTNAAQQAVRQRVSGLQGGVQEPQPSSEQPASTPDSATSGAEARYIAPTAVAVLIFRPAQVLSSEIAELLPTEVATAAGTAFLGINPADIDEVTLFIDQINPMAPSYGLTIKFNKPFRASALPPFVRPAAKLGELNGKKYLQSSHPMYPSFYGVNSQTMVVAPDATLRQLIESHGSSQSGPILDRVRATPTGNDLYLVVDVANLKPLIDMAVSQSPVKGNAREIGQVLGMVSAAEVTLNMAGPGPVSVVVHGTDEAAAQQLESMIAGAMSAAASPSMEGPTMAGPIQQALDQYKQRMAQQFQPRRDGTAITCFHIDGEKQMQKQLVSLAVIGGLVSGARMAPQMGGPGAAPGNITTNNMKQLMLACLNYESARKGYPPHAIYSADGQPLLSWRVQILPFLEQQELFEKFKLDEPWDSEHNRALIAEMPDVFANPGSPLEPGKTNLLAVVGPSCIFSGTAEGVRLRNVTDGTSNTIALVEAAPDQAVEWTKPDDLEFDPSNPTGGLNMAGQGWNAAFADGSVRVLQAVTPEMITALFTMNAGEVINQGNLP